ncbi:MAG: glycosyl hydrolase [Lentisphaeria bacterium]
MNSEAILDPFIDAQLDEVTYRPILVWAMNDRMNEAESRRQLESFRQCGYGGVMVMPWGDLPYEFISDEWLDRVGEILGAAKELGMDVWIWDEWLFGSGPADGRVTSNKEYRAKTLKITVDMILEPGETAEFQLPERTEVCGIFAVDKHDNPVADLKILGRDANMPITVTADHRERLIVVGWQYTSGAQHTTRSHGMFLDPDVPEEVCNVYFCDDMDVWSVDMMKPEATRLYLQEIHEKYYDRFSDEFGKTLKGFFYDEPKASSRRPWTNDLLKRFEEIKGYDLHPYLIPMLFDHRMEGYSFNDELRPRKINEVEADYRDVWTSMLADGFYREIQLWCQEHGVIATGHPIGDNNITVAELLAGGGMYFKNMDYSDMPGVDIIWGLIAPGSFCDSTRLAGSRAAVHGKPQAMSESFSCFGHGVHLDQMRYVMENEIIRGVSKFFNKLTNYNREKSFYYHPPDLSDFNPIIKHYGHLLNDRIMRLSRVMFGGRAGETVGLFIPLQNYFRWDESMAEQLAALSEKLAYNQIEFDFLWDADIMNLQTREGKIVGPHGREYRSVLIPANAQMDDKLAEKLEGLQQGANGQIVWPFGPGESVSMETQKNLSLANQATAGQTAVLPEKLADALEPYFNQCREEHPYFELLPPGIPIASRGRIAENGSYACLLLNEALHTVEVSLKSRVSGSLIEVDINTGEAFDLGNLEKDTEVDLTFVSSESKLLVVGTFNDSTFPAPKSFDRAASLPLDNWRLKLPDEKEIELGSELPSWNELGWPAYTGFMRYRTEFTWQSDTAGALLDLGTVHYAATVWLDDERIGDCIFTPFHLRLDDLKQGDHVLELDVLNTQANAVFGSEERIDELTRKKAFKGTYAPIYKDLDLPKLRSGLFGPVKLIPGTG